MLTDAKGRQHTCRCLVVATGLWEPYIPDIPGIETTENYVDCSIDPEDYVNQRVLIIGKGNSAFETANHINHVTRVTHICSPHSIKLAWKTHFFGHLRAINNDFLDTYILKGQNSGAGRLDRKHRKGRRRYIVSIQFTHAEGQRAVLAYDRVLACTGFRWDNKIFNEGCCPESFCEDRLPNMTSSWESPNVPGMFFAGTLMQMRDLKKTMSNVLHGFRFNVYALARIVMERFGGQPWETVNLPGTADALADKVIERVSSNAGMMHQPGFLCDAVVWDEEAGQWRYYDVLSVEYALEERLGNEPLAMVITMEYGDIEGDPLSVAREPDPAKAYNDVYLHPLIRVFRHGKQTAEHHMSETLENDWRLGEHPGERALIREMEFVGQEDATPVRADAPSLLARVHRGADSRQREPAGQSRCGH